MVDAEMLWQAILLLLDVDIYWLLPLGLLYGIAIGALPGMTASLAIALVLPFTFHMTAIEALVFLSAIFTGGVYGGSITAIMLNMPGSPASAATSFDGFPMAREGKQNEAQGLAIGGSMVGSMLAAVVVLVALQPLARFALMFGPVEMLMVGIFALTIVASFKGETLGKGIMAGAFGLLLGTIGVSWGRENRGTFGSMWLIDGLPIVPIIIAILAMPGLFALARERFVVPNDLLRAPDLRKQVQGIVGALRHRLVLLRCSLIGIIIGTLPAAGASVASLIAWNDTKQSVRNNRLGEGDERGVVASEAANNSSEMGSTAMMLALGIPGGGATAILLGAFMIHGITPGPRMLTDNLHLGYALVLSQFLQVLLLPLAALLVLSVSNYILKVPNRILLPVVLVVTCWGIYTTREAFFDIALLVGFGIFAYILNRYGYPIIALLLGVILAKILEPEMIRATATFGAENLPYVVLTRPISLALLILTLLSLLYAWRVRGQGEGPQDARE